MKIKFSDYFKISNIISILFFLVSILLISFKGLNYGIDFKGGTLFEVQIKDNNTNITINTTAVAGLADNVKGEELGQV